MAVRRGSNAKNIRRGSPACWIRNSFKFPWREPFRVLFPLGIGLAWLGIGHWIAYWAGWIGTYSCTAHGLVQIQGFLLAFAVGFLLTAIPRRTASEPASAAAIVGAAVALVVASGAAFLERWWIAEGCTIAVLVGIVALLAGASSRGGGRRPRGIRALPLGSPAPPAERRASRGARRPRRRPRSSSAGSSSPGAASSVVMGATRS
jgi:hypothetical protein